MKNFIGEQHIRRRKVPSLLFRTGAYRPAVYKPIDQIKQRPAHIRRRHKNSGITLFRRLWRCLFDAGKAAPGTKEAPRQEAPRPEAPRGPERSSLGSLVPAGGLIGAVLFFAALTLNWLNQDLSLYPGADRGFRPGLASYAGISPAPAAGGEAIPLDLMETFSWTSYTVKKGDSVSGIAAAHAISMDAIIASNGISNARRLREGEGIRIPNMDGIPYTVKKGDSLSQISSRMGVPLETILDANDIQSDTISAGTVLFIPGAKMRTEDLKLALGELFIYPIRGRLTSPYGWRLDPISGVRRYHAAVDLAAALGTPIKAAMDGKVSSVGFNSTYGKFIILSHANGYQTLYAHMNLTSVNQGDYVQQGAKIGEVGNTGYSTGPHLHFAVYKNGRAVNPLEFLNS